jgi:hypothetical protein
MLPAIRGMQRNPNLSQRGGRDVVKASRRAETRTNRIDEGRLFLITDQEKREREREHSWEAANKLSLLSYLVR